MDSAIVELVLVTDNLSIENVRIMGDTHYEMGESLIFGMKFCLTKPNFQSMSCIMI